MKKVYVLASLIAVAMLIGVGGMVVYRMQSTDQFRQCRPATIASAGSTIGGPFTLVNGDGQTVTDSDVFTKPSLLYFGFTNCPDVCPVDNARNAAAADILAKSGIDVTPVMISIDPARDTPPVMKDYTAHFSDSMIGLTGSPAQVMAVSKAYKTYYRKIGTGDDYEMDHSTYTYLVLPKFGFVEFFRRNTTPADMAKSVGCFVRAS